MAFQKSIFRQLIDLHSRLEFQSIVNRHNGDFRSRTATCWDQYIHLMFAQLSGRDSLRDTIDGSLSQINKLYHLGAKTVPRSTLSDANNKRPNEIYKDVFFTLLQRVQQLAPKYKLKLPRKLFLMDSTVVDLCLQLFPWAKFRKTKASIKVHAVMQADGSLPTFIHITEGKVHDVKAAWKLKVPEGSYLVFDRGYHDFNLYNYYNKHKIRFITRKKTNAKYRILEERPVDKSMGILRDQIVEFTGYVTHKKYPHHLRIIEFWDDTEQKRLIFLTNDLTLDAKTIADIYKARWEIELFFRVIKQNLKIKRFIGYSENAVKTQVWIAMIAYLLISYYKFLHKVNLSIQKLARRIQVNLFERKSLLELIKFEKFRPPETSTVNQMALFKI